jgi:hypothetical protein
MNETYEFPADQVERFDPSRFDIFWNADYTRFNAVRLSWWDDRSYADYQGDNTEEY